MKHSRLAAILIAASISMPSLALADSVAIVNGTPIDKTDVDQAVNYIISSSNGQAQDTQALREDVKNRLINRTIILQEARQRGLDKTPEVQRQVTQASNDILQDALFADILKQHPIDEARIRARYNEIVTKVSGTTEVHPKQITLASEEDAKKVIAELNKGASFDKLVATRSIDANAKQNGGDMGYGNLSTMAPPLAETLKTLKVNKFSQTPFHSNLGWHVFKMLDIRPAVVPEYAQIKPQIARQLQEEEISQAVNDLRSKAKIQ